MLDEKEEFPWEIMKVLGESDLFAVWVPEEYGGLGGGVFEQALVVEELSRACSGVAVSYAASGLGSFPIIMFGSDEQKQRYLPDIASGKRLAAFALTEANAGSDVSGIATTAVLDGDEYVLNGTKQWITNGGEADIYTVIAVTDKSKGPRGSSAFIVGRGEPGVGFGGSGEGLGMRGSAGRVVVFGFVITMKTFDKTRPGIGAQAVGIAQGALDEAVNYARQRVQFGQPISSFQGIQFMLADMATQIEAARALVYSVARWIDSGAKDVSQAAAMAKLFASDVCMKVTVDAVQILGGYGYMREYPVEKMMRDAKITQIYEGTNQIQRSIIALDLIKKAARKNK